MAIQLDCEESWWIKTMSKSILVCEKRISAPSGLIRGLVRV